MALNTVLALAAAGTTVMAAARSTWSPCGVSMLATVTPLAERGRGHRYRTTAAWFVVGAGAGGATLGLGLSALAWAVRAAGPAPEAALLAIAGGGALVAAAADARLAGFRLPVHHRQVNERWLDQFRAWVYGAGFGWQIGTGVVTYVKTAAVYLLIVLAALTGSPLLALGLGVLFGLVRGLAVFLGRGITSPDALAAFHRRFTAWDPVSRRIVVTSEVALGVVLVSCVSPWAGGLAALSALVAFVVVRALAAASPPAGAATRASAAHVDRVDPHRHDADDDAAVLRPVVRA
jgi:hypothetical protein